jgi:hypothetical protein
MVEQMNMFEGKQEHPGWALQTKEGDWLAYGHGWHISEDAFYARIFPTQEEAQRELKDMQEDFVGGIECDIVPAWEPACGKLRHEVRVLTAANKFSPDDLFEIRMELESILSRLSGDGWSQ